MNDEERLGELVGKVMDHMGWSGSKNTFRTMYYHARHFMARLGGFDALCSAEQDEIQSWVNTRLRSPWTAYSGLLSLRHVYDFLVDEGVIGFNPALTVKVGFPTKDEVRKRPAVELKDLKRVFALGKRRAFTLEGAKSYLVLCLKLRCGVQYSAMAMCRVSDLELSGDKGVLRAYSMRKHTRRQVLFEVDEETAWAFGNYFKIRGRTSPDEPLIAKSGYHGTEAGGFYRNSVLQSRVSILFDNCGMKVGDYDLGKTVVMLAYAEGANAVQAAALAARDSLTLAARVAEELPCADPRELRRKLLQDYDSNEVVAVGMMRSEDVMAAVRTAYTEPYVKVVVSADGWAKFELPD